MTVYYWGIPKRCQYKRSRYTSGVILMEMLVLLLRSRAVATFSKYRAFQRGIEARLAAELGQGRSTEKATATNLSSIDHLIANSSGGSRKLFTNLSHLFFCFNPFLLKRILNNFPDNFLCREIQGFCITAAVVVSLIKEWYSQEKDGY